MHLEKKKHCRKDLPLPSTPFLTTIYLSPYIMEETLYLI